MRNFSKEKIRINKKIQVFISSICGNGKYDSIRKKLKNLIENTGIAEVYLFEDGGASTLTAEQEYLYSLDDSDVCIFLIDNADGVPEGVLKEHQRAKGHPKKSIYIFCDENQKESTYIQEELKGAEGARYYITNSFQEFVNKGYQSFIDDIVKIYVSYCRGRFINPEFSTPTGTIKETDAVVSESLEKQLFKNTDMTKRFIIKELFSKFDLEIKNTCDLDTYGVEFLKVLFGYKKIEEFNTGLLLLTLEEMQSPSLYKVVTERWKAIQYYWKDDLNKAIECENQALNLARELQLPNWIIQDILIDLRNIHTFYEQSQNRFPVDSMAQKELDNETVALFYPLLDRYEGSLYREILIQNEKSSTKSPYTVTFGGNMDQYGGYISNIYMMAVFNGSLTHILRTFDRIRDVAFNLCSEYSNWEFRVLLLKIAIIKGDKKGVRDLINLFNDVYGKMNALDSKIIYEFSKCSPVGYQKEMAQLHAFQHLGYFFSDNDYLNVSTEIIEIINKWIESEEKVAAVGDFIFGAIKDNIHRLDNQTILNIMFKIVKKELFYFYDDLLEIIAKINFNQINDDSIIMLVEQLNDFIMDENIRSNCYRLEHTIISVRRQMPEQTGRLHENVIKYMSDSFKEIYFLEVQANSQKESENFIYKYILEIKRRNYTQGQNGKYSGYVDNPYKTIANIINNNNVHVNNELMKAIIDVCKGTLYSDTQLFSEKVKSIRLMTFLGSISDKPEYNFVGLINQIIEDKELIFNGKGEMFLDKTSGTTLHFNFVMMKLVFHIVTLDEILNLLGPYTKLGEFERLEALKTIVSMFEQEGTIQEIDDDIMLALLQFALQLSYDKSHNIRYFAVRSLLHLINNQNKGSIMRRVSEIMDYDSAYIKGMILDYADKLKGYDAGMYQFIKEKASVDNHYVIRNRVLS